MHWIRTQNNILINAEILVRIDLEPKDIAKMLDNTWVIKAYYSHNTSNTDFQVLLMYSDMDKITQIFDDFVKWLSQPNPSFQVFDFRRWPRPDLR